LGRQPGGEKCNCTKYASPDLFGQKMKEDKSGRRKRRRKVLELGKGHAGRERNFARVSYTTTKKVKSV